MTTYQQGWIEENKKYLSNKTRFYIFLITVLTYLFSALCVWQSFYPEETPAFIGNLIAFCVILTWFAGFFLVLIMLVYLGHFLGLKGQERYKAVKGDALIGIKRNAFDHLLNFFQKVQIPTLVVAFVMDGWIVSAVFLTFVIAIYWFVAFGVKKDMMEFVGTLTEEKVKEYENG